MKGFKELLSSWAQLDKIHANCALVIIGSGPEEKALNDLVKELQLQSVYFTGAVDYDQIAPYYAAADAFIIATLEDNWSLVVPEAMVCGLPILCSKYNGCHPELVRPGENGWVFDPFDREDTCNALRQCIENKPRLKEMGEKSKEIVSHHTPHRAAQAILEACNIAIYGVRREA